MTKKDSRGIEEGRRLARQDKRDAEAARRRTSKKPYKDPLDDVFGPANGDK